MSAAACEAHAGAAGVGVGFTLAGRVLVRNLIGPGAWLFTPEAALKVADAFEGWARDAEVIAAGHGSLEVGQDGCGFVYTGAPSDLAAFAAELRDAACWAVKQGAAGHA